MVIYNARGVRIGGDKLNSMYCVHTLHRTINRAIRRLISKNDKYEEYIVELTYKPYLQQYLLDIEITMREFGKIIE